MAYSSPLALAGIAGRLAGLGLAAMLMAASTALAAEAPVVIQGVTVKSWGYQLINDDPAEIAKSPYDIIVMDYQRDPSVGGPFKKAEVDQMKKKPDGSRRFVIAYISIGEVEDYRYYWGDRTWTDVRNRTPLVEKENPEWPGNLSVHYWEQEWQNLILADADSYINRIMDAGFDGIYLDKIDELDLFKNKTPAGTQSDDLMIEFVRRISTIAKARNPNFLIIAQNAEGLLDDDDYRSFIDGIGKESVLYSEGEFDANKPYGTPKRNSAADIKETERLLSKLRAEGKVVMVVEYIDDPKLVATAAEELGNLGYIPYFGPRDLAHLNYAEVTKSSSEIAAEAAKTTPKKK